MLHFLFVTVPVILLLGAIPAFIYFHVIPIYKTVKTKPRPYALWKQVRSLPLGTTFFGNWLLHYLIMFSAPYSASIYPVIENMTVSTVSISMTERFSVRNPFNSVHVAALTNLGELTVGMNIMNQIHGKGRAIPVSIKVECLKKARGKLLAVSETEIPSSSGSDETNRVNFDAETIIYDEKKEIVSKVATTWSLEFKQ